MDYSKLEFAGNPKIVEDSLNENYVFVEKFVQELKGKNGEILYYVPSIPKNELNPILLENMMRNDNNPNGTKNDRIQYLNIDSLKSRLLTKDELDKLFKK